MNLVNSNERRQPFEFESFKLSRNSVEKKRSKPSNKKPAHYVSLGSHPYVRAKTAYMSVVLAYTKRQITLKEPDRVLPHLIMVPDVIQCLDSFILGPFLLIKIYQTQIG